MFFSASKNLLNKHEKNLQIKTRQKMDRKWVEIRQKWIENEQILDRKLIENSQKLGGK